MRELLDIQKKYNHLKRTITVAKSTDCRHSSKAIVCTDNIVTNFDFLIGFFLMLYVFN